MPLDTCPNCQVGMQRIRRSEVQVDICPQCRGVWLDRGELETLLTPMREQYDRWRNDDDDDDDDRHPHQAVRPEAPPAVTDAGNRPPPVDDRFRVASSRRKEDSSSWMGMLERLLRALD